MAYDTAMCEWLTSAVTDARPHLPQADADEVATSLLAFARGREADLSDPRAPVRRLRRGAEMFVAGLDHFSEGTARPRPPY
ncbi:hypothetical protein ACWD1Z_35785 [Streptomyces sp. NPDC002784]